MIKTEKWKQVYPSGRNISHKISRMLLAAAVLVIITGFFAEGTPNDFSIENVPRETAVPLQKEFDETWTEMVVDLPERSWYALQLGAYEQEESAGQSSRVYQKRGAAGYVWEDGRFRVLAAVYPAQEDAQRVREQLKEQHDIDSYLYPIVFPTVTMRVKGMKGQLEILQASFAHADDLCIQLQRISIQMDRQEISVSEAYGELTGLAEQLKIVSTRLHQRFTAPVHAAVQALIECFTDFHSFTETLSANASAVELGMQLKYQNFTTLSKVQKVYQALKQT